MSTAIPKTMRAVVLRIPGPPPSLKIEKIPTPTPQPGQVLIKVRAFGLNRSEVFTRQGHSPISEVSLPRVLGIECVGTVAAVVEEDGAGKDGLKVGDKVATCVGGMGRAFDGGYAEFCVVPRGQVVRIGVEAGLEELGWDVWGALPEMIQTSVSSFLCDLTLDFPYLYAHTSLLPINDTNHISTVGFSLLLPQTQERRLSPHPWRNFLDRSRSRSPSIPPRRNRHIHHPTTISHPASSRYRR